MRKFSPSLLDVPTEPRVRRFSRIRAVLLGVLLTPLVYESTLISMARWRSMLGGAAPVETPVLDGINADLDRIGYAIRGAVAAWFQDPPWQAGGVLALGGVLAFVGWVLLIRKP